MAALQVSFQQDEFLDLRQEPGSMAVSSKISSRLRPTRKASPTKRMRSGPGVRISWMISLAVGRALGQAVDAGFQAAQRLLEGLWKVRPMAITSPTDFICVAVRRASAIGNFSKAKRGILVTT